ncbi:MAG TPA: hypothetical protein VK190_02840 [Pseudoneobacillus sp.]|nr:hypothetical protein [Pseudoneobacillus sp.]
MLSKVEAAEKTKESMRKYVEKSILQTIEAGRDYIDFAPRALPDWLQDELKSLGYKLTNFDDYIQVDWE